MFYRVTKVIACAYFINDIKLCILFMTFDMLSKPFYYSIMNKFYIIMPNLIIMSSPGINSLFTF